MRPQRLEEERLRAWSPSRGTTERLSDLLGAPIIDADGRSIGRLADLLVPADEDYPWVVGVAVKAEQGESFVAPWRQVAVADDGRTLRLRVPRAALAQYTPSAADLFLAGQVLDRQIIDVNGVRVIRANDLHIERVNGSLRLLSVDVSTPGLLHRIGVERPIERLVSLFGGHLVHQVIDWRDIDPVEAGEAGVRLKLPAEDVARLRPADLAAIISQLDHNHAEQAVEGLDVEQAADTFEELAPERQAALIGAMDAERAADIIEAMDPDDAADLLADMEPDRQSEILGRMQSQEAREVRALLQYAEDTAGGVMTSDFVALPQRVTVGEAIELVRQQAAEIENVYSLCVVDARGRLSGVLSLRDLIVARPEQPLTDIVQPDPVAIRLDESREKAAQLIAKYDLLALPVVDEDRRVHGIVTVDDAMDLILPAAWKTQLPRIFR